MNDRSDERVHTGNAEWVQSNQHDPGRVWATPSTFHISAPRTRWYQALPVLQDILTRTTVKYFHQQGLLGVHLPVTTGVVSSPQGLGSDSLPVGVELFGKPTYLADSMQFLLEYTCRLSSRGCYYMMQSFRGERPDSTHLNQFMHIEAEILGDLDQVLALAEGLVLALAAELLEEQSDLVLELAGTTAHVENIVGSQTRFERITFDDAAALLGHNKRFMSGPSNGEWRSLTRLGERELLKHFGSPLWVTHWDHLAVPFYQAYAASGDTYARNADLLLGPGEIIGAGERHADGEAVRRALTHHRVPNDRAYKWYCDIKDAFPMLTGGFGLGTERLMMWVLNHSDIRDLQIVPRLRGIEQVL